MRNAATYTITKDHLCFVCHGKPDNCQEDFNCGCCCPDNAFLCKNKYASQQSEICWNTYSEALPTLLYILSRCVVFPQKPWRGPGTLEIELLYVPTIVTDIKV